MNRIFISSNFYEKEIAYELAIRLEHQGLYTIVDSFEADYANEWLHHILYKVESSDVVLLLISDRNHKEKWNQRDFNKSLKYKLKSRNLILIPVYLGRQRNLFTTTDQISFSLEKESTKYESKKYSERSINKLVEYITNLPKVNFELFSHQEFEELIVELLKKLNFFDIQTARTTQNTDFDISAKTKTKSPFGGASFTSWAIEIKHSRNSRADLASLKKLSYYLEDHSIDVNGVLITDGQLTSTALEWLEYNEREKRTSITVIDGLKLKQLILNHPELVEKFFGDWTRL